MYDYVFATLIAFVLVCFYESKRLNDYNSKKIEKPNSLRTKHTISIRSQEIPSASSNLSLREIEIVNRLQKKSLNRSIVSVSC